MRKLLIILMALLLMLPAILQCGCSQDRTPMTVYVSHDANACKSINVDCSKYLDKGYDFAPFSDSTGCGCSGLSNN